MAEQTDPQPNPRPTDVEQPKPPEVAASFVMRLLISLALPVWGIAMLAIGARNASLWWMVCGLAVVAVGAIFFVGSPLLDSILDRNSV